MGRRDDFEQNAEGTPFDNSDNGYDADNTKDAIIEAGNGTHLKYIQNKIYVAKNGDDTNGNGTHHNPYLTIYKAIDSITDASSTNPYSISIGPGEYTEVALTIPSYITLIGLEKHSVTIVPSDTNHHICAMNDHSGLTNLTFKNVGSGYYAICVNDTTNVELDGLRMLNCDGGIYFETSTKNCTLVFNEVDIFGLFNYGIKVLSQNNYTARFEGYNFNTNHGGGSSACHVYLEGTAVKASIQNGILSGNLADCGVRCTNGGISGLFNVIFENTGTSVEIDKDTTTCFLSGVTIFHDVVGTGIGVKVYDGGTVIFNGLLATFQQTAITTVNTGISPTLSGSVNIVDCTNDLIVNHTTTLGNLSGVLTRSKITNNAPNYIQLTYQDPVDGDFNITRIMSTRGFATDLTEVISASQTTQMYSTDAHTYIVSGSTSGQILKLPDSTTLRNGHQFWIVNDSTVQVTVQYYDSSHYVTLNSGGSMRTVLRDNSTSKGLWNRGISSSSPFNGTAPAICGYGGNAGVGRFLEFFSGNSSDNSPFIIISPSVIVGLSIGGIDSTTCQLGLYLNGNFTTPIATLTLTSQQNNYDAGLNIPVSVGDLVSAKIISGSINKPFCSIYISGQ